MNSSKLLISLLCIVFHSHFFNVSAQNILPCGTDENLADEVSRDPERQEKLFETERLIETYLASNSFSTAEQLHIIPVVVHIIYSNQNDNIENAQVYDAISILNEDSRRTNPDTSNLRSIFKSVAADLEVEFRLAKKDPNGKCTKGITRTQSNLSLAANNNVKSLIGWDNKKYLNIWVVRSINLAGVNGPGIVLGYAAFPYNNIPGTSDGIVIRHQNFGSIGTAQADRHRTLTHEVGHYLNLYHTFQGGCGSGDNCFDTPPVTTSSTGCSSNQNTCSNDNPDLPDMIENYMDYTDDDCMNTFTQNQKQRTKAVLNSFNLRGSLTTASNHFVTGINQSAIFNCDPVADFIVNKTLICSGEQIQITENCAYQLTPSFHYTISDQNKGNQQHVIIGSPLLTFNNPGLYDVKLEIQNSHGQSTKQYSELITVRPQGGVIYSPLFSATMEKSLPNDIWTRLDNGDNIRWNRTSIASKQGLYSYYLENFNISAGGGGDALIAGPITLNNPSALQLKFNHAFARKQTNNTDKLSISTSTDCGNSWTLRKVLPTFQLGISNLYPNSPYVPTNNDWIETTLNLNSLASASSIMIKFEMSSGGGNNVYIDNLNLSFTINNLKSSSIKALKVYPNPSNNNTQIQTPGNGDLYIIDALGRVIQKHENVRATITPLGIPAGSYVAIFIGARGDKQQVRWTNIQ